MQTSSLLTVSFVVNQSTVIKETRCGVIGL